MKLSLIGMSGSGKTYWSKKLEKAGYLRICCDDLIEERLSDELVKLGYKGIQDVARWMGQPYEERYKQSSKKYLNLETEIMKNVLETLKTLRKENIVVDTTGSVIYAGQAILTALRKLTTIAYLNVPESVKEEMFEIFLKDPKPIFWGKSFQKNNKESNLQALSRCYPKLLQYRSILYKRYADITIDYFTLRKNHLYATSFLKTITSSISS